MGKGWENIYRNNKLRKQIDMKPSIEVTKLISMLRQRNYKRILDLGCGTGRHTLLFAKEGFETYATDIAPTGIKLTKELLAKNGLEAKIVKHDMKNKFPFEDNFFDAVISIQVIHHNRLKNIRKTISEIYRMLKSKGLLFVTVPKGKSPYQGKKFKKIERNTFMPTEGREKGVAHHYFSKAELEREFSKFRKVKVYTDKSTISHSSGRPYAHWALLATK